MYRVIIVGCGFAGLFAANALRRAEVEVVVVDRTNHHLFQALLYQVATGVLSEGDIAPPIRDVLRHHRNTRVLLGEVVDIDVAERTLTIDTLGQTTRLPYDSLILATGATQASGVLARMARVTCWNHSPASGPSAKAPVSRAPSETRVRKPGWVS